MIDTMRGAQPDPGVEWPTQALRRTHHSPGGKVGKDEQRREVLRGDPGARALQPTGFDAPAGS